MKVNLAWLKDYVDLKVDYEELLSRINTQLGEIETITNLGEKYRGILIVKVVDVKIHPQADKLRICLIDDAQKVNDVQRSEDGYIQVVCGAANVKAGMLAVWLPPQTVVPATFNQGKAAFKLEAKELRGVLSYGMLASPAELDISSNEDEILEVKASQSGLSDYPKLEINDSLIGQSFAQVFDLQTTVIEIENKMFTQRPDCFGLLGIAREVAAITKSPFKKPAWYYETFQSGITNSETLNIDIQCPDLVKQLRALIIKDIKVDQSDLILQTRLASIDFKPVNNVVDLTNYLMYISGQPTHAFDYDKLLALSASQKEPLNLIVRQTRAGEELKLLNGKTLAFNQPAVVIATDKQPVALGGIMGGSKAEVDYTTKRVLLECANFNMYNLRHTTMHYGIFSEAATRFTKRQSLAQIPSIAQRTASLIEVVAKGQLEPSIYEFEAEPSKNELKNLSIKADFINQRLGSNLKSQQIANLLEAVEFKVQPLAESLELKVPFWRTDIEIAEDIVEEVGRLNGGYMALKPVLPKYLRAVSDNQLLNLKTKIRHCLAAQGANEVSCYSFMSKTALTQAFLDPANSFHLLNPLNPNLQVYRQSIIPSLLKVGENNRRAGYKNFALFEIGCVHQKNAQALDEDGLPTDLQRIGFIYHQLKGEVNPFYVTRRYLDLIAQSLSLKFTYQTYDLNQLDLSPKEMVFDLKNSATIFVGDLKLGVIGLLKQFDNCAAWEIDTEVLLQAPKDKSAFYQPLAKYPKSSQDLTLQVPLELAYSKLKTALQETLSDYAKQNWQSNISLLGIFQPVEKTEIKNISFRLTVSHKERTVKKEEVSAIVSALAKQAQLHFGASLI